MQTNWIVSKQCYNKLTCNGSDNETIWTGSVHCRIHVGVPSGAGTVDGMPIWRCFIIARDLSEHFLSHSLSRLCRMSTNLWLLQAGGETIIFLGRCTLWPSGSSMSDPSSLSLFSGDIACRTSEDVISVFSLGVHVDDPSSVFFRRRNFYATKN